MAVIEIILVILALVCFAIAFFNKFPPYNWTAGGFFCVTAALLLLPLL